MDRIANISRSTTETKITAELNVDGAGNGKISTGIGFFDHMLVLFAKHGFFDLSISVDGDLSVDAHHTVEDTGLVLGRAFFEALGEKSGITRYGHIILPMDDALILASVDLSGRAFLSFDAVFTNEKLGDMDSCLIEEFFTAFCTSGGFNLHIKQLSGKNGHHISEGIFKAVSRALDTATRFDPRQTGIPSTKGRL